MTATQSQIRDAYCTLSERKPLSCNPADTRYEVLCKGKPIAKPNYAFWDTDEKKFCVGWEGYLDQPEKDIQWRLYKEPILQSALDTQKPAGALSDAPCDKCGYNGPGYYQPDTHGCAALNGDCGGGDHPPIEGLEAAINNSITYPMVNDVGFQSEHDRRVVMQAARRYLAITAENAKSDGSIDYHLNALRELGHDVQIVVKEGEE